MALPPRGDPRRPLHLAVRSMRILGILYLGLSTCVGSAFLRFGRGMGISFALIGAILFYVTPGVCYVIFSIFLQRRQFWAVVASLVLAGVNVILILISLVFMTVAIAQSRGTVVEFAIPLGAVMLILAALAQLIYHLSLSFEAIKYTPPGERGFEPLMASAYHPPTPTGDANGPSAQP